MDRVKTVLDQYAQRKAERSRLNELWEEIAEVLAPERCGFIGGQNSDRYQTRIYDTTPIVAISTRYTKRIDGREKHPQRLWMRFPPDELSE